MGAGRGALRSGATLAAVIALSGCSLVGFPGGGPSEAGRPPLVPARTPAVDEGGSRPGAVDRAPAGGEEDPATFVIPEGVRPPDNGHVYEVFGREYRVLDDPAGYDEVGMASWYGPEFHGRSTASGERFDQYGLSAAHRTLPLHTFVEVTNTLTGESVVLRVNDRGPFARTGERIIDVSYGAAVRLSMIGPGTAPVRVRVVGWAGVGSGGARTPPPDPGG